MNLRHPEMAESLLAQSLEILRRWEARVRSEIPASRRQQPLVLRNNLHLLLREMAEELSPGDVLPASIDGLNLSQDHGEQRAELPDYTLSDVFLEYRLLRRTILEVLDERRLMSLPERDALTESLERSMQDAGNQYALTQHREERQRGDVARAAYERERRITRVLQRPLLLQVAEDAFEGLSLATFYEPLKRDAEVGGDFLDAFALPNGKVALVVGDACGKGLEAAIHNTLVKELLRVFLREDASRLGTTLTRLNDVMCDTLHEDGLDNEGHFIVLAAAVLDPLTGKGCAAAAGAEPPLVLRADGSHSAMEVQGMPLGIAAGQSYQEPVLRLGRGDSLVMLTDGITEARVRGKLLGYEGMSRLAKEALEAPRLYDAGKAILDGARAAGGGVFQDDVSLILARKR